MPFPNHPLGQGSHVRTVSWGDVYWFDFGRPVSNQYTVGGPRPALVLSDCQRVLRRTVTVTPISGLEHRKTRYAFHVPVLKRDYPALDKDSIVKIDQLYCINRDALIDEHYITTLSPQTLINIYAQLVRALYFQGLPQS
jgi:mRNA-degrading endonuclease toxin of MazEF toxin-antitoxin module